LGIELKKPRGGDGIFVAEYERKASKKSVGFGSDFPRSCLSGTPQALFGSKKRFGRSKRRNRTGMGDFGEREDFRLWKGSQGGCGQGRGKISGEGSGKLVVLDWLECVGSIQREKETDWFGSVRRHRTKGECEIEPGPRPGFSRQIFDRNQNRSGDCFCRRGEVGKKLLRVWNEENRDPKAKGSGRKEGESAGNEHDSF
jgi:hypothetical protein